jgi:hypothetical protein
MESDVALLEQVKPMIFKQAYAISKQYHVEYEELVNQGYYLFVEALHYYRDDISKFSTYFYWRLKLLSRYAKKLANIHHESNTKEKKWFFENIDDYLYLCSENDFTNALEKAASSDELSDIAKDILEYLLLCEWKSVVHRMTNRFLFQEYRKRGYSLYSIKKALKELVQWWNTYYYIW